MKIELEALGHTLTRAARHLPRLTVLLIAALATSLPHSPRHAAAESGTVSTCTYTAFMAQYTTVLEGGTITFNCDGTITLPANGTIIVYDTYVPVTLDATGHNVIFQGNGNRIFLVQDGASLTLRNIKITGGTSSNGGGIYNDGTLIVEGGSQIYGNTALTASPDPNPAIGNGGGIYNSKTGTTTVRGAGTSIHDNLAQIDGGGIFNDKDETRQGMLIIEDGATVSGNTSNWNGGGILNNGTALVQGTGTVIGGASANTAIDGEGGGIYSEGTLTVQGGVEISGNVAQWSGGGIFVATGTTTVSGSVIGTAAHPNTAWLNGGGILNDPGGTLIIENGAVVAYNTAGVGYTGGGLYNNGTATIQGSGTVIGPGNGATNGAGVGNTATLTLQNGAAITGNTATGNGGGVNNSGASASLTVDTDATISGNTADDGGGIFNTDGATTTVRNSATISGNTATNYGGGIRNQLASTVTVQSGAVVGGLTPNTAQQGAGIYSVNTSSTVTIQSGAQVYGNGVMGITTRGGGIYNGDASALVVEGAGTFVGGSTPNISGQYGGGIYNTYSTSTVIIRDGASVAGNSADADGGGIYNTGQVTVTGSGTAIGGTFANTANYGAGIYNYSGGIVTIQNGAVVAYNTADNDGGGVYNNGSLTISGPDTIIGGGTPNSAQYGGGLYTSGAGSTLTINQGVLIENNTAINGPGGGIYNNGSTLSITDSTLSHNTADTNGGGIGNISGPLTVTRSLIVQNEATVNGGGIFNSDQLQVLNSTFSGNTASSYGGAVYNTSATSALTHVTVYGNTASGGSAAGGGIYNVGSITLNNSLFSTNTGRNCGGSSSPVNGGGNWQFGDQYCGTVIEQTTIQPVETTLNADGTHHLVPGSEALDSALQANCPATDQRGVARGFDIDQAPDSPQPGDCDSGAFELTNTPPTAGADSYSVPEDSVDFQMTVLSNDTDPDIADVLGISMVTVPSYGSVSINDNGTPQTGDDWIAYTPTANYNGADSFEYTLSDGSGGTDTGTVSITVTAAQDNPVAADDGLYSTPEDTELIVTADNGVLINDTDPDLPYGDSLSISTYDATSANGGTVSLATDGSFTFMPYLNFNGMDTFTYTIADGQGHNDTATVSIEIGGNTPGPVQLISPQSKVILNSSTFTLVWSTAALAVDYQVQIHTSSNFLQSPMLSVGTPDPSYTGQLGDGTYYWRARALNDQHEGGPWSDIRVFEIDATAPAAPQLRYPSNESFLASPTVRFRWELVDGRNNYQFQLAADADFTMIITEETLTRTRYSLPSEIILPGTYYWRVGTVDSAGNASLWSETRAFTYQHQTVIQPPVSTPEPPSSTSEPSSTPEPVDPTLVVPPLPPNRQTPEPPPHDPNKKPDEDQPPVAGP